MLDKKENNENYNYVLSKCKEYLSVHMGSLDTSFSPKEGSAIITLKVPFLMITDKIVDFLNEARDRIQNIMIFSYGGKELSIKILVDYSCLGESELQKAANRLFNKGEDI